MTQGVRDFAPGAARLTQAIGRPAHGGMAELPLHLRQEIERECRPLWLAKREEHKVARGLALT
jgi:hypothetical protein